MQKKRKLGKNPTVDTSFLPDRDREVSSAMCTRKAVADVIGPPVLVAVQEAERQERERLRQEWVEKQGKTKS